MGHEDRGGGARAEDPLHLVAHLGPEIGVQVRERLVEEHDRGGGGEGAREGHALLLAAGELVRVASGEASEPDQVDDLGDPIAAGGPGQAEAHVVAHGQVREQGVVLEHDADAALLGRHRVARPGHEAAAQRDGARVRGLEARDEAQRGGLAAARGAEQGQDLALGHPERQPVDRRGAVRPEALADPIEDQQFRRLPARISTSGLTGVGGRLALEHGEAVLDRESRPS